MKLFNPASGKIEEVKPQPKESCQTIHVVVVENELLRVVPEDQYRVYMTNGSPAESIAFLRALGHTVVVCNEAVTAEKRSGSWCVRPHDNRLPSPKMADTAEDLLTTVESVLYLALLHGDYSSLGALLKDVQDHNASKPQG